MLRLVLAAALALAVTTSHARAQWKANADTNRLTDQRLAEMKAPIRWNTGSGWFFAVGCAAHGYLAFSFVTREVGRKIDGEARTLLVRIDHGPLVPYSAAIYTTGQNRHAYRTVPAEADRVRQLLDEMGKAKASVTVGFPNWPTHDTANVKNAAKAAAVVLKVCGTAAPSVPQDKAGSSTTPPD